MLSWDVGKINPQKLPSLKGTMSLQAGASKPDENPTINIQFKIQQMAISGTVTPSDIGSFSRKNNQNNNEFHLLKKKSHFTEYIMNTNVRY